MALFGHGSDRNFDPRRGSWDRDYDRAYRSGWQGSDRDRSHPGMQRYEPDMRRIRYQNDYGHGQYDRDYKSRWQTDHGDPFGDRSARTPMRVIRGGYRSDYDRGYRGGEGGRARYDRDFYQANPMGYDPYSSRPETRMRGYDRGYRSHDQRYDTGWFW